MPVSQHEIAGTTLTMPVKIRKADQHTAVFLVPAAKAQRLVDYSGLQVCEYLPGRTAVMLMLVRYHDGDLGKYHEFGTAVMVNPPGAKGHSRANAAAFIHHLPVDQSFTLEAGNTIWGFPKVMADFTVRDAPGKFAFDVTIDGQLVAGIEFSRGLAVPSKLTAKPQVLQTYSHRDGITREIPWEMSSTGLRSRPGGARLWLGNHPYARELATLGLPRRPVASLSVDNVEMTFGDAHVLA